MVFIAFMLICFGALFFVPDLRHNYLSRYGFMWSPPDIGLDPHGNSPGDGLLLVQVNPKLLEQPQRAKTPGKYTMLLTKLIPECIFHFL